MTDSLLKQVGRGSNAAMKSCIDQYGGLVWTLARRFCATTAEAEDAVQEIFVALWQSADRFDPTKASEATFISVIARRRLIDRVRARSRRPSEMEFESAAVGESKTFDDVLQKQEDFGRATQAIDSLTADQQTVLRMSICAGMTHEIIAEQTGLPLGTVKTNIRRGLLRIREILEDQTAGATS